MSDSIPCVVFIREVATGEVRQYHTDWDGQAFIWKEGNYACDCNRELFFKRAEGEDNLEGPGCCSEGRYVIDKIVAGGDVVYTEKPVSFKIESAEPLCVFGSQSTEEIVVEKITVRGVAGPEMDAAVGKYVMGWEYHVAKLPNGDLECWRLPEEPGKPGRALKLQDQVPAYSTDIAAAWLVVDALAKDYWMFQFNSHCGDGESIKGDGFGVVFQPYNVPRRHSSIATSGPLAICMAALRAKGIEVTK